jgi:hemin uptake protein HemP
VLPSAQLLGPHQSIEIEHNGQRYRLQSTRSGKLILTK